MTFLIPCLNEEESLGAVLAEITASFADSGLRYEIVVADNGSTDRSREIAVEGGARVVPIPVRGYGAALQGGIASARGAYTVMGDADGSYQFGDAKAMIELLRSGQDIVMGNRFRGTIEPGAMPWLHQYLGNPVLSALGRILFRVPVGDFHSGIRAFSTQRIRDLGLKSPGMEFASEMLVVAMKSGYSISEVPVTLKPDLRSRAPHLKTWRDGWRHLRFLLSHSPSWTFLVPAGIAVVIAVFVGLMSIVGPINAGGVEFSYRTGTVAMAIGIIGTIAAWSFVFAREIVGRRSPRVAYTTELTMIASVLLSIAGLVLIAVEFFSWSAAGFGPQSDGHGFFVVLWGSLLLVVGGLSFFFAMLLGLVRSFR
ncbi:glycosyltransferase family 2 protein [soil metagenome]